MTKLHCYVWCSWSLVLILQNWPMLGYGWGLGSSSTTRRRSIQQQRQDDKTFLSNSCTGSNQRIFPHIFATDTDPFWLRRDMMFSSSTVLIGGLIFSPSVTLAATPTDAGEAIRRGAASIPGLGPTDIFFPSTLIGSWNMAREVEFGDSGRVLRLTYPFRFIQSIEDDSVVADRGANQAALEQALREIVTSKNIPSSYSPSSASATTSFVRSYDWTPNNPNDLRLVFADGSRKELKVTKRAQLERTDSTIFSTEFQRVTQEDSPDLNSGRPGIPVISARRVVTKWYIRDNSTIEGLEIVYDLGGGDPLSSPLSSPSARSSPPILSKSRLYLVR